MEVDEPVGLLAQRAPRRGIERPERLKFDAPAFLAPGARDGAVDEERRQRMLGCSC